MARYPKQNDPGGKNVIPSVTEILSDCTDGTNWAIPYGANQACDWIRENCVWEEEPLMMNPAPDDGYYLVTLDDLRRKRKDEKKHPDNARYAHKHHSQKALDIGSEVHRLIEDFLKGKTIKFSGAATSETENAFDAFLQWSKDNHLEPIALEQTVYGDGWAGTLDFRGFMRHKDWDRKKAYVIDWKSSKAHYPEMRYQSAAYRSESDPIIQEYNGIKLTYPIEGCGVLRLDKETGLPDWKDTSKSYEQDLRIFNRMVDLYFERHPIIRRRARG